MIKIESKNNEKLKYLLSLKDKKYSLKYNECFVESEKIINQLLQKQLITSIFVIESKKDNYINKNVELYIINDNLKNYISDCVTSSGIFAIAKVTHSLPLTNKFLVLDGIQDPNNFGAILRSACAFDYKSIICLDSAYAYSPKVIRSSMGYVFDVNIINYSKQDFIKFINDKHIDLIVADMKGENITHFQLPSTYGLVLGNEGNGVSKEVKDIATKFVSVKMLNNVESLNVVVSASIIMYNLM